jgi:predicted transposase YdaD
VAGRGFTPLLPFYILKLRKAAKRAKTDAEKREVEDDFKELGLKLKEAIEAGAGNISEEDIVTLLERLRGLVKYTGRGYRTVEVKTMLNNSLKGYGQVLLERGERRGRLEGERKGEERKALEIARNLKSFGSTTDQIARATGLPDDVIAKL